MHVTVIVAARHIGADGNRGGVLTVLHGVVLPELAARRKRIGVNRALLVHHVDGLQVSRRTGDGVNLFGPADRAVLGAHAGDTALIGGRAENAGRDERRSHDVIQTLNLGDAGRHRDRRFERHLAGERNADQLAVRLADKNAVSEENHLARRAHREDRHLPLVVPGLFTRAGIERRHAGIRRVHDHEIVADKRRHIDF